MTLTEEFIKYYIHPGTTIHDPGDWDNRSVYVTWSRRAADRNTVQPVRGLTTEHQRLFYITQSGDRVLGHPYNWNGPNVGGRRVAFLGGGKFALFLAEGTQKKERVVRGSIEHWSDLRQHVLKVGAFPLQAQAAPWASDLWPLGKENEEVAAAKMEQAKLRWEMASKKLAILNEGHMRGWLDNLREIRAAGHNFPEPTYGVQLSGQLLIRAERKPTDKAIEKLVQQHKALGSKIEIDREYVQSLIAYPFSGVFARLDAKLEDVQNFPTHRLSGWVRDHFNDHSLDANITSRTPVMSGVTVI